MASLPHTPPATTPAPSSQLRERNLKTLFSDSQTTPEHTATSLAEEDQSIPGAFPSETDLKSRKEEDAKAGHPSSTFQDMKHTVEALADYAKEYLPASLTAYMGGRKKENADGEPSDSTKDKQSAVGPQPKDNMPHHNPPKDAPNSGGTRTHAPEHCDTPEPVGGEGVGDPLGRKEPHSTPSQPSDIHAEPHEQSLATVPESPEPTVFDEEVRNRLHQGITPKTLKRGLDTTSSISTTSEPTSSRNPQAPTARDALAVSSAQTQTRNDSTRAKSPTVGCSGRQEVNVSAKPTEYSGVRARDAGDGATIEDKEHSSSAPATTTMEQSREPSKEYAPNIEPVGTIPHEGPKGETLASASTSSAEQHEGIKETKGKDNRRRSHGSKHGSKDKEGTHEVEGQGNDEKSKGGFGKRLSGFFRRKSSKQQRESEGSLGSESPHSSGSTSPAQSASTPQTPTSPQSAIPTEPRASFFGEETRREQPGEGGLFPLRQAQKEQKGRQKDVETAEKKTILNVGERLSTNQTSPQRDPSARTPSKTHPDVSSSDHAKKTTPVSAQGADEGPVTGSVPEQRSVPLGLEAGVSGPATKAQGSPHPEATRRGLVSELVHGAEEAFYDAGDVARNYLPGMVGGYLPHHQEAKGDTQATSAPRSPEKSRSHMASPSAQRQPAPAKPSAPKQSQTPPTAPGAQIRAQQGDVDRDVEDLKRQARPGVAPTSTPAAQPPKGQLPADVKSTARTRHGGTPASSNMSSRPSRRSSAEISPRAQLSTREQISGKPSNVIEPLREEYIKSVIDDSSTSFGTEGTLPGYPSQAGLSALIGERMYDDHMRAAGAKEPVQTTTNTLKREAHLEPQQVVEANPSVNVAGLRDPCQSAHRMRSGPSTTVERGSTSELNSEGNVPAEGLGKKVDPGPEGLDFNMWTSTGSAPKPDSRPGQHPYGARIRVDDLGVPINTDTQERKDYVYVQKNGGKNMSIN